MFSNGLMDLTDQEKEAMDWLNKAILAGRLNEVDEYLGAYAPNTIYKLSLKSDEIKQFCEKKETYGTHEQEWARILKIKNYPGYRVDSIDGNYHCSIYNQYVGSYLFGLYKDNIDSNPNLAKNYLNQAINSGIHTALVEQCKSQQDTVKVDPTVGNGLLQLTSHLEHLGNTYWSMGYFLAAAMSLSLGNYFSSQTDETATLSDVFFKESVRYFCCMEILFSQPLSQQLTATICGTDTLTEFVSKQIGKSFTSWDQAKAYMLERIDNNTTRFNEMREGEEKKINLMLSQAKQKEEKSHSPKPI